ncbi:hypothetical protein H8M03_04325 [Sphingomonas sabuli]|uniref:Uncharacterized protein n=1 Tax=Sphingomonas sabuli TaxID=2764186 RepID=A0A7G9L4L1_9SPHN|nr:hypothetical protein [Sphingomonas sabuli]QNM83560.1 hypothetical protein H8M03_04325 [Sphingomonas sabuli]
MRLLLAMPLLFTAACSVNNDATNDEVTVQYDQNEMEEVTADMGAAAENAGEAIGNVAEDAAGAVRNTDVDIDVDTNANDNDTTADANQQ